MFDSTILQSEKCNNGYFCRLSIYGVETILISGQFDPMPTPTWCANTCINSQSTFPIFSGLYTLPHPHPISYAITATYRRGLSSKISITVMRTVVQHNVSIDPNGRPAVVLLDHASTFYDWSNVTSEVICLLSVHLDSQQTLVIIKFNDCLVTKVLSK